MSIEKDGWLDWTTHIPGVPDKVYSEPNSGEWITCHSVVGEESEFQDGIPNRFLSTERLPNGRYTDYAAASSMFVLRKSGELIQMYPVTASTWTSGGRKANTRSWAIEAEGGQAPNYSEPLTPEAEASFVRLVREWEVYSGKRAKGGITLLQHKDVAARFGYAATACASDRYRFAWLAAEQREEDEMSEEDRARLDALEKAVGRLSHRVDRQDAMMGGYGIDVEIRDRTNAESRNWQLTVLRRVGVDVGDDPAPGEVVHLEDEQALEYQYQMGSVFPQAFSNLEDEVDKQNADHADLLERFAAHISNHAAGAVADHIHETGGPIIENGEE